jgi:hypothetical protein
MLIDLSSDKHLASSTQEPSTETRLMFPNDLVAKSTLNGLSFGEGGNGIKGKKKIECFRCEIIILDVCYTFNDFQKMIFISRNIFWK